MNALAGVSLLLLLRKTTALRLFTASTTADAPRRWAVAASVICLLTLFCRFEWFSIPIQIQSALQYVAAVMLLTPFIGILGARRPGANAWPWFVVLPLIVVLQWPSVSQLMAENADTAIEVPTPTLIGFAFVLMMGTGNYFGTVNTGAALCCAVAASLLILPLTEWMNFENWWCFPGGCLLLTLASLLLPGRYFQKNAFAAEGVCDLPRLWSDFRDIYGIVWAKRVMDRVNQFAEREAWDVRMSLDGFIGADDGTLRTSAANRQIEVLCWVLQRFVDRPFLRRYLPESMLSENTT